MARRSDLFGARVTFETDEGPADLYRLRALQENGVIEIDRLPFAIRVMLEGVLRQADGLQITSDDVRAVASWCARAD